MWVPADTMAAIPPMTVLRVMGHPNDVWVTNDWVGEDETEITELFGGGYLPRHTLECWQEPRAPFPVVVYPGGRTIPLWQYHEEVLSAKHKAMD